jgi:hypothetical protein
MSTIVTRAGKGSALTHNEVDANFTNLNTDKLQSGDTAAALTITSATFGAGTVSAPSLTTSGDTNTGIFFPAADTIAFAEGGVESMRIDSSGNVGIGTTAPASRLHVSDAGSVADNCFNVSTPANDNVLVGANLVVDAAGTYTKPATSLSGAGILFAGINNLNAYGTISFLSAPDTNTGSATPITRMIIDADGNVGLKNAVTAPIAPLHIGLNEPGGEAIRLSWNTGSTTQAEASIGFGLSLDAVYPNAEISGQEIDTSDYRGNLLFYTRGTNSDIAPTERMRISSTGLVTLASDSGLSISATAVTAPASTDGNVFSGTYTPTLTNTTNIAASTPFASQYMRVGNVVTVSGRLNIDPTTSGAACELGISLPIASDITTTSGCAGTGSIYTTTTEVSSGGILGDTTNNRATFRFVAGGTAARDYGFTFTYLVA